MPEPEKNVSHHSNHALAVVVTTVEIQSDQPPREREGIKMLELMMEGTWNTLVLPEFAEVIGRIISNAERQGVEVVYPGNNQV